MTLSNCAICDNKKSRFIKSQEAKGILSDLGLKTPLSKIQLFGDIVFINAIPLNAVPVKCIKVNIIVKKFS